MENAMDSIIGPPPEDTMAQAEPPEGAKVIKVDVELSGPDEEVDFDAEKSTITLKESAYELLADEIMEQFERAVQFTGDIELGEYRLEEVIQNCYEQMAGIPTARERALMEHYKVPYRSNRTALKVSTARNWLLESLGASEGLPVSIMPSPIPSLRAKDKEAISLKILQSLDANAESMTALANSQGPEAIVEVIMGLKERFSHEYTEQAKDFAERAAKKHEALIRDQLMEGGYYEAMDAFMYDVSLYPFACMVGPRPIARKKLTWVGDKYKEKTVYGVEFKAVHPSDVWWSEDCTNGQDGTAVYYRHRMGYNDLKLAAGMSAYIKENVEAALEDLMNGEIDASWTAVANDFRSGEGTTNDLYQNEKVGEDIIDNDPAPKFLQGTTVEVITRFGLLLGRDLKDIGVKNSKKLDDDSLYEATVSFIDKHIIQVFISPHQGTILRPIHFASFEKMSASKIPGASIAMKIRDDEMLYNSLNRLLVYAMAEMAAPAKEVDVSRVADDMASEQDIATMLAPGNFIPVQTKLGTTGQGPVVRPIVSQAQVGLIQSYMEQVSRRIDVDSGIVESMHGQPVGTGVNRTFRGVMNLQANATKGLMQVINNVDATVVAPIGQMLYEFNMQYSDDENIKGDARVSSVYGKNALTEEIKRQQGTEFLQVAGQMVPILGDVPGAKEMFAQVALDLARTYGYDIKDYESKVAPPEPQPQQPVVQDAGVPMGGEQMAAPPVPQAFQP